MTDLKTVCFQISHIETNLGLKLEGQALVNAACAALGEGCTAATHGPNNGESIEVVFTLSEGLVTELAQKKLEAAGISAKTCK